ncbi:UNVERIFIED_CONTAM: Retrovirus-related Pol polyprotein from transposon RE1 [Sesamum latifolium]|uniref:Retrovirus-related Pol polyprotein from transposon RE1 n=1 Tax=Sesamum latifolium TaxID=2727402 RepID=A0AAW2UUL4_9LAMI
MFESGLPRQFWADSILTTIHIINKLPSSKLNWKTPFELLHTSRPSYDNFKTFGCLCFASNVNPHNSKFDPRAFKCIFLGYVQGQNGHKVFDIDNKVTFILKDVVFHEHIFPYLTTHSSCTSDSVVNPTPISDSSILPTDSSFPPSTLPEQEVSSFPLVSAPSIPPASRPHRHIKPPAWMRDFHCHSSIDHSYNLASSHNSFMVALSTVQEPNHYMQSKGKIEWENAIKEELAALDKNNTWEVVDLPKGKRAIVSKWVFKLKWKPDGTVDRYKARLVAKGYNQVEGEDYIEQFSPVAKAVTNEDIYMLPPDGAPIQSGKVCKTEKISVWPHQASRQWNQEFTSKLLTYEDILLTSISKAEIAEVKHFLDSEFTIKDLGPANYFLGLEITRCAVWTSITQHKYVRDIIQDVGLNTCKPVNTPLPVGIKLSAHQTDPGPYRRLVGRLLYLNFTMPHISFGAQQLGQLVHQPAQAHMDATLHLVRYLKGSPDQGLFFPVSNSPNLRAFCDADWAGFIDSWRSLSDYCIFLGHALVSWKSKKQSIVARSTAEVEYRSLGTTICELKWISYLLQDLHLVSATPILVYCDNQAAIHIVANLVFHERTKHIEIECHLIQDHYKSGFILPSYVPRKS